MIDLNKEREAFEAYLKSIDVDMYYIPNIIFDSAIYRFKDEFNADEDQEAALEEINTGWFAWIKCAEYKQAEFDELKAKLEAAQVPEGFVLVPKEPTGKMISAGYESKEHINNLIVNYKAMIRAAQDNEDE